MSYTIITAKDDTVLILNNGEADWTDYVDCDTKEVKEVAYLNEV
jgi:hypothetical protein